MEPEEKQHFMICPECGKEFDMRDLSQVAEHMHEGIKIDPKEIKNVRARKIGDPVEWKDGKGTHLN